LVAPCSPSNRRIKRHAPRSHAGLFVATVSGKVCPGLWHLCHLDHSEDCGPDGLGQQMPPIDDRFQIGVKSGVFCIERCATRCAGILDLP
jgi:hypothetical protein